MRQWGGCGAPRLGFPDSSLCCFAHFTLGLREKTLGSSLQHAAESRVTVMCGLLSPLRLKGAASQTLLLLDFCHFYYLFERQRGTGR